MAGCILSLSAMGSGFHPLSLFNWYLTYLDTFYSPQIYYCQLPIRNITPIAAFTMVNFTREIILLSGKVVLTCTDNLYAGSNICQERLIDNHKAWCTQEDGIPKYDWLGRLSTKKEWKDTWTIQNYLNAKIGKVLIKAVPEVKAGATAGSEMIHS